MIENEISLSIEELRILLKEAGNGQFRSDSSICIKIQILIPEDEEEKQRLNMFNSKEEVVE